MIRSVIAPAQALNPNRHPDRPGCVAGFTLVECAVAVAVLALSLAAGMRASGALILSGQRQVDQQLAQWCAENQLVALRLQPAPPAVGRLQQTCVQAGRELQVLTDTRPTPDARLRRVETRVMQGDTVLLQVVALMGPRT